jgi:uridine phosphorylase
MKNANFPVDDAGRVYHLGLRSGDLASNIIVVGDLLRAQRLAQEHLTEIRKFESHRGFVTFSGIHHMKPISIVSIGMGMANMDIFVREARSVVVESEMRIIRFGSCGTLRADITVGSVVVASGGAFSVIQDPDASNDVDRYRISPICGCDQTMSDQLCHKTRLVLPNVFHGVNGTCDTFYASQGRRDENFEDRNQNLLQQICETYPNAISLEMETYQLFELARRSRGTIKAAAITMVFANRVTNDFIDMKSVPELELIIGRVIFETLVN